MKSAQNPDTEYTTSQPAEQPVHTVDAATKEKNRRLVKSGLNWLCVGIGLMGLSLLLNFAMLGSSSVSISALMYIITSLGAVCMIKSMIDIMG